MCAYFYFPLLRNKNASDLASASMSTLQLPLLAQTILYLSHIFFIYIVNCITFFMSQIYCLKFDVFIWDG